MSDKRGTAQISLNPNSELNAITSQPDIDGAYETVEILCLDECESMYAWDEIDFIKLDAEGQEHNIIRGGKHFLTEKSPLIMFELKHQDRINTGLIQDFSALGYQSYRLVPGLNVLIPFHLDRPLDSYQLNLFCCKDERARHLEERGILIMHSAPTESAVASSFWREKLGSLPYARLFMNSWDATVQGKTIPGWNLYENALNHYVTSHNENEPIHSRLACLLRSCDEISAALGMGTNLSRLLTYARVLSELGQRSVSNQITGTILNLLASGKMLEISEPFIPVSQRYDAIEPVNAKNWIIASILEHKEKIQAFSSFYTGSTSLTNLEALRSLGHQTPEMERRRQLIRMRYGLQDGPVPDILLQRKTNDNINPDLWECRN